MAIASPAVAAHNNATPKSTATKLTLVSKLRQPKLSPLANGSNPRQLECEEFCNRSKMAGLRAIQIAPHKTAEEPSAPSFT